MTLTSGKKHILEQIYFDPGNKAGFTSVSKLYKQALIKNNSIKISEVKKFLTTVDAYTIHKATRKIYPRQSYLVNSPGVILGADTAILNDIALSNDGYKYLGIFADMYSRYMYVFPLKTKTGKETAEKLDNILSLNKYRYRTFFTDKGSEYYNNSVNSVLKKYNVKIYSVYNSDIKNGLLEVMLKNLKNRIYKYMTFSNSSRYIDILPKLVTSYNNTAVKHLYNRSPAYVHNIMNRKQIRKMTIKIYKRMRESHTPCITTLTVGEHVRITLSCRTQFSFNKFYKGLNSSEIFTVAKIDQKTAPVTYFLKDLQGKNIKGKFYVQELTKVSLPNDYKINILKTILNSKGEKKHLVKWIDYPTDFNCYIKDSDLV